MNDLQIFTNDEFGQIRTMMIDNVPWFAGKDVADKLGYKNTNDVIMTHIDQDDKRTVLRSEITMLEPAASATALDIPNRGLIFLNESGLYSLILGSKLDSAKRFKRWVTSEVIPSIRKNGGYIAGQEHLTDDELLAKALVVAQSKIEEKEKMIRRQQEHIERVRPKEIFADAVAASQSSILIGELAKILRQNGIDTGEKRLFEWMRREGYLIRRSGTDYNAPTQRSIELKILEIKERTITNHDGSIRITRTTMVTGKGQQYFINKFLNGVS